MKENNDSVKKQVLYLGRWVDREFFRTFVYKSDGEKKLAKSYAEFEELISSGIWFDSLDKNHKQELKSVRKPKHDSSLSVS